MDYHQQYKSYIDMITLCKINSSLIIKDVLQCFFFCVHWALNYTLSLDRCYLGQNAQVSTSVLSSSEGVRAFQNKATNSYVDPRPVCWFGTLFLQGSNQPVDKKIWSHNENFRQSCLAKLDRCFEGHWDCSIFIYWTCMPWSILYNKDASDTVDRYIIYQV